MTTPPSFSHTPRNAKHTTANGNNRQHPNARQANGGANYFRIDQISFHLLESNQIDNKQNCLHRRLAAQDKEKSDCSADISACHGNQCSHTNYHASHDRIGEAKNQHTRSTECSKDNRFHTLTNDVLMEAIVGYR